MCLSKAYFIRDGSQELLMEEIASIDIQGEKLLLKSLFGEEKEVTADIKQIDFMTHHIFLQERKQARQQPKTI